MKLDKVEKSARDLQQDAVDGDPTAGTNMNSPSTASQPSGTLDGLAASTVNVSADELVDRQWIHESGYGGKGGGPRLSSEQREASEHSVHKGEWPEFSADMLAPKIVAPKDSHANGTPITKNSPNAE